MTRDEGGNVKPPKIVAEKHEDSTEPTGSPKKGFVVGDVRNVIIIGSGPAGYTAGIYCGRAGLNPLLIASSVEAGGELMKTTEVENYPGFPSGLQGPELMDAFRAQAERFGTEVLLDDVIEVDLAGPVKIVKTGGGKCDGKIGLNIVF